MESEYKSLRIEELSGKDHYYLMTSCIVPRPIALVTSYNRDKSILNAAPFSYFNGVSRQPSLIMLGIAAKPFDGELINKDTSNNIRETGEFVINIPSVEMASIVEGCSELHPSDVSEVETLGLETIPSTMISVPRLKAALIQMECRLYQAIEIPPVKSHLILGEVLCVHVNEQIWENGRINVEKLDPLSRIDAGHYATLGKRFKVKYSKA